MSIDIRKRNMIIRRNSEFTGKADKTAMWSSLPHTNYQPTIKPLLGT